MHVARWPPFLFVFFKQVGIFVALNLLSHFVLMISTMNFKVFIKRFLLASIMLLLVLLAWEAFSGGLDQFPRSETIGQKVETVIQLIFGLCCLLVVLTCFWWREWARPIRVVWAITLVAIAGLSPLVWGPPMPDIALLLAVLGLFISLAIIWALQKLTGR